MSTKMNKTLAVALERCPGITPTTLEEFLGALLDEEPDQLARMPGTPGTVLAAQFTCYAKSSATVSEVLRRQAQHAQQLTDAIWRIGAPKEPETDETAIEEADRDSDSLSDPKRCLASAGECA